MSYFNPVKLTTLEEILDNNGSQESGKRQKVNAKRKTTTRIKNPEYSYYSPEEKYYFNKLDDSKKMLVASLETLINVINEEDIPIRFKVLFSNMDDNIKAIAIKKLSYLCSMSDSSSEYYKNINWIESLCRLPIGKYVGLPISKTSGMQDIRGFITNVKDKLDSTVYGHKESKHQIIRLIAQWVSNPDSKGLVIGIQGAMGTGKTSLVKNGICKALGLPFAFVALGGASDGSFLEGHSYTYEGSTWGKIVDILIKAKVMNPVVYFDELDKVSSTYRGEEITNILVHITDMTQNDKYQDKYFTDIDFDLSRCLMIFSYNDETAINPILKDRMVKIKTDGYNIDDKIAIAHNYLIKEIMEQFKFKEGDILFSNDIIRYIINNKIEEEEGVRNLKRALESIVSNINLNHILSIHDATLPINVTENLVNQYVLTPKDTKKNTMMYV
jgi:ATP-dependent Lon protease